MLINDQSVSNNAAPYFGQHAEGQCYDSQPQGGHMTKGEQTRRKIVACAAPMFNQRGYEGSSLALLMEATGLEKGCIYRHFTSKEEIAAEAFDYSWNAAWETRMQHVEEAATGLGKLKQFIANFIEYRSPVEGGCPLLNTAVDSDDGNPVLRDRAAKALRSWTVRLQAFVKQAVKAGETRPGVDPKAVSTLVVASLEGASMMARIEGNREALRRVHEHLNQYIDREIAAAR